MKKTKMTTFLSAFAISAVTVFSPLNNIYAENDSPLVYDNFNTNDVNGTVTVKIPKETTAEVKITFTSPEVTDEPYYIKNMTGGDSYSFDIEGRDTTENDYRNYTLNVAITGGQYEDTAVYKDTFTVPDGNDNPDSFMKCDYNFSIDDKSTGNSWDITSESKTEKNIVMHLNSYIMGDLNNDGLIDAVDATAVLIEYAEVSTSGETTLSERQKLAGDINKDGIIDAVDASMIQVYYAEVSTHGNPSWDDIINDTPATTSVTTITTTTTNTNKTTTNTTTNTTKATTDTTTNTTKSTTNTTTTEPASIDYSSYMNSVKLLDGSRDDTMTFHNYYIYDINNDGIYELITEMGTCEADNQYSVYSMKNGEMIFAGDITAGHTRLVEKDGKLYTNYGMMGNQSVDMITFDGEKISKENVYSESSVTDYIEYGTAINSYDWSDMSGINKIKNTDVTTTTTTKPTATTTESTTTTTTTMTNIPQSQLDAAMKKIATEQVGLRNPQYCYTDINNDSIPELLMSFEQEAGVFVRAFTFNDNEFVSADSAGAIAYICHDNSFIQLCANAGAKIHFFYYINTDGNFQSADKLSLYGGKYYNNDKEISKSEYDTILEKYQAMTWTEPEYKQVQLYESCPNIENAPEDMIYYSQPHNGIVATDSGTLNMRTGAGTNYSIITSLMKGTKIQILGANDSWCYVKYSSGDSDTYGFMSREFVKYPYESNNNETNSGTDYSSYYDYISDINNKIASNNFNGLTPVSYKLYDIDKDGIQEMIMYFFDNNDSSVNSKTCWHILSTKNSSPFIINAGNTDSSFRVYNNKLYYTWLYHGYQSAEPVTFTNGTFKKNSTEMSWDNLSEFHEFGSKLTTYDWSDMSGLNALS